MGVMEDVVSLQNAVHIRGLWDHKLEDLGGGMAGKRIAELGLKEISVTIARHVCEYSIYIDGHVTNSHNNQSR